MGCDIHSIAQKYVGNKWVDLEWVYPTKIKNNINEEELLYTISPFDWRSYRVFGFLGNVRNYSAIEPISKPRGLPKDILDLESSDNDLYEEILFRLGDHSFSWLTVDELKNYNYDQLIEDRRTTVTIRFPDQRTFSDGGQTCGKGYGNVLPLREFLGPSFFEDLNKLIEIGADRIVFGFDS